MPASVIGANCDIKDHVYIDSGVHIGDRVVINNGVQLWSGIVIEDDVVIGPNATFTNDHLLNGHDHVARTLIQNGASIGANATILQGLEIGARAKVSAGAVVTRSVPPNAIVAGNPARIVGYTETGSWLAGSPLAPSPSFSSNIQELGIGGATLHRLKAVSDMRGDLSVGEFERDIPFAPRRYFLVYNVPSQEARGEHAHKECHQFLICIRGSCQILLDDGKMRREVSLDRPDIGVHMPPLIWGTQYRYSSDAILLVFASHFYDASDYIRTYSEFLEAVVNR